MFVLFSLWLNKRSRDLVTVGNVVANAMLIHTLTLSFATCSQLQSIALHKRRA